MPFIFDATNRTITEQALPGNPAIARYNVLSDLFGPACDWWIDGNQAVNFPLRQEGFTFRRNNEAGDPVYSTADIYLANQGGQDWRIVWADYATAWGYRVIELSGANLLAEDGSEAIFDLSDNSNPVVVIPRESDIQSSYFVDTGSGLSAQQATQLSSVAATLTTPGVFSVDALANTPTDKTGLALENSVQQVIALAEGIHDVAFADEEVRPGYYRRYRRGTTDVIYTKVKTGSGESINLVG